MNLIYHSLPNKEIKECNIILSQTSQYLTRKLLAI